MDGSVARPRPGAAIAVAVLAAGALQACLAPPPRDQPDGAAAPVPVAEICASSRLVPPGQTLAGDVCTKLEQCQREAGELARCTWSDAGDTLARVRRCHRLSRGQDGDPCTLTIGASFAIYNAPTPETFPAISSFCDLRDDLECAGGWCVPLRREGQSCAERPFCARGLFCDEQTVMCRPSLAVGEHCAAPLDFDGRAQCEPADHCDIVSDTCVPRLLEGAACEYDPQCASDVCLDGACVPLRKCSG